MTTMLKLFVNLLEQLSLPLGLVLNPFSLSGTQ